MCYGEERRVCVRVRSAHGGRKRLAFLVWLKPTSASYTTHTRSHELGNSLPHAIVWLTCLNKLCYFKQGQLSIC